MGTTMRPEISSKNKYWIERHRYYELKHFCLQYPLWKKLYSEIDGWVNRNGSQVRLARGQAKTDPLFNQVESLVWCSERIQMLEKVATETDPVIGSYILKAVTTGLSYDALKARLEIPCSKDIYYDLYRRFFWLLSRARN